MTEHGRTKDDGVSVFPANGGCVVITSHPSVGMIALRVRGAGNPDGGETLLDRWSAAQVRDLIVEFLTNARARKERAERNHLLPREIEALASCVATMSQIANVTQNENGRQLCETAQEALRIIRLREEA